MNFPNFPRVKFSIILSSLGQLEKCFEKSFQYTAEDAPIVFKEWKLS